MRIRFKIVLLLVLSMVHIFVPCLTAQTVLTVKDAEFRTRWTGKQVDRETTPQYFLPDGGLSEAETGVTETSEQKANWMDTIDQMAQNLERRLRFGPLDFQLGINTGWQYSNQNSLGTQTDSSSSTSLFAATNAAATYEREIGMWSVSARYSAGYNYFFNQDYTAAGQGNQRNPLAMTAGIDIGYNASRLSLNLGATASSGNGFDIVSGVNNFQTAISTSLSARYVLTETFSTGAAASINYSKSSDAQTAPGQAAQPDSNQLTSSASIFADYLFTPKTNFRFVLSAGQDLQKLSFNAEQGRRYFDAMLQVTYQIAPKFSIDAGGGLGYVSDQDIPDPAYTGLRPVYTGGISYTPTEKTYFKANISMQGADIKPNLSLAAGWNMREKTRLSLSLYQNQGFSSLSPDQYNITRGVLGTISQRLIKGFDLSLSGGYEQSSYVGLSKIETTGAVQGPADYFLSSATLNWRIREWAGWQNSLMVTTGRGENSNLQTTFSSSLNFNF